MKPGSTFYLGKSAGVHGGPGTVTVDGKPLSPRLDLRNHSPTGFAWGYGGSGPAQLALALLSDFLGDDEQAQQLYQQFKSDVISRLDGDENFTLTGFQISAWIKARLA